MPSRSADRVLKATASWTLWRRVLTRSNASRVSLDMAKARPWAAGLQSGTGYADMAGYHLDQVVPSSRCRRAKESVLMIRRMFTARADLIAGPAIVAVSLAVAIWMHRTDDSYSCLLAPCNPILIGYPLKERLVVVVAGLVIAALVIAIGSFLRHHAEDSRAGRSGAGQAK